MRLAIVTDLHADLHALIDAIAQAKKLGCDRIVCAGDIVDGGLFPQETIELLIEHKIPTIRGNHDRWAIGRGRADDPNETHDVAPRDTSGWDLSPRAVRYLSQLPTTWGATCDGVKVAVRHGSPRSDMDGVYPETVTIEQARAWMNEVDADVMLVGHTHIAFAITFDGKLIANPGALWREHEAHGENKVMLFDPERGSFVATPVGGGGTFGILDTITMKFTVHVAADGSEIDIIRRQL